MKSFFSIQMLGSIVLLAATLVLCNVWGDGTLPTPTCPNGFNTLLPNEIVIRCRPELEELYEPNWARPAFAVSSAMVLLCFIISLAIEVNARIKGYGPKDNASRYWFRLQSMLLGIVIVLFLLLWVFSPLVAEWMPGPSL